MTNNWQTVKLSEVTDYINRGVPPVYTQDNSGTAVINQKCVRNGQVNFEFSKLTDESARKIPQDKLVQPFDILVNSTGTGTVGRVGQLIQLTQRATVDSHVTIVRPNKEKIDPIYLGLWLKSRQDELENLAEGSSNQVELSRDKISNVKVTLPSLNTQMKIASILSSIDETVQKTDCILQKSELLKKGIMQGLLNFGNNKNVRYLALGDIGKVSMCKRIYKNETSSTDGIPFYKIGTFGKYPDSFIPQKLYEDYRTKFPFPKIGDILISASGTIGRKVKYDGRPAYFQDSNIIWLEHDESKVLNDYLFYLYDTITWQTEGSTIKRLYNDIFLRKIVAVPPISKQKEIIEILSDIDTKISVNIKLKEKLILLKKGLMHDIFSQKVQIY